MANPRGLMGVRGGEYDMAFQTARRPFGDPSVSGRSNSQLNWPHLAMESGPYTDDSPIYRDSPNIKHDDFQSSLGLTDSTKVVKICLHIQSIFSHTVL